MGKLIIRLGGGLPRIELVVMGGGGGGWFIMVAPYRQTVTSHMYSTVLYLALINSKLTNTSCVHVILQCTVKIIAQ